MTAKIWMRMRPGVLWVAPPNQLLVENECADSVDGMHCRRCGCLYGDPIRVARSHIWLWTQTAGQL